MQRESRDELFSGLLGNIVLFVSSTCCSHHHLAEACPISLPLASPQILHTLAGLPDPCQIQLRSVSGHSENPSTAARLKPAQYTSLQPT
eukprot:c15053_g1_i2 orf=71-337(+)